MQDNLFTTANDKDYQIKNEMDLIEHDWSMPDEFPDLRHCKELAVDLETCDPNIKTLGQDGHVKMDTQLVSLQRQMTGKDIFQSGMSVDKMSMRKWHCVS